MSNLSNAPPEWVRMAAKRAVKTGRSGGTLIKGQMSAEPADGLFQGFSASGPDVWVDEWQYEGPGIVLSAVGARCGKAFRADGRWTAIANTHVLLPAAGFDRDYLWYVFNNEDWWERGGSAQPYVRIPTSLAREWAFPPYALQRRIADFLDRKTAAIDELIAKKERLALLLQEKRQAVITQAVTKGLDPGVRMKESGIEWIGRVPEHWEVLPIKRLARRGAGTFTDGDWIEAPFVTDSGVRLLQTGNVGIGYFKEQGFRYVSEETFTQLKCTEVLPGDVLICRLDGPVGRACLAPRLKTRMITSVDNAILKPARSVDPRFVVYVLSMPKYLDWVQGICRVGGGFRFRISRSMLGEFRIPAPSQHEQKAIADRLDISTSGLRNVEGRILQSIAKLREYRQSLITAAVTGKIDVGRDEGGIDDTLLALEASG